MARTISAVGVAVGYLVFGMPAAAAGVAAWCAVINYGEDCDCQYRSLEACRPNALAKRGGCNPSPYLASSPTEYRRPKKSRGRAQYVFRWGNVRFRGKTDMPIALQMSAYDP